MALPAPGPLRGLEEGDIAGVQRLGAGGEAPKGKIKCAFLPRFGTQAGSPLMRRGDSRPSASGLTSLGDWNHRGNNRAAPPVVLKGGRADGSQDQIDLQPAPAFR